MQRFVTQLRRAGQELVGFIFGESCAGCGRFFYRLCPACARYLGGLRAPPLPARQLCYAGGALPVFAAGEYRGQLRRVVVALKHQQQPSLARYCGQALHSCIGAVLRDAGDPPPNSAVCLVPVPSRREKLRERGYSHLRELLRAARLSRSAFELLEAASGRTAQVGADALTRLENARALRLSRRGCRRLQRQLKQGAVAAASHMCGSVRVVLVDDVCTTGASLIAAADSLHHAGFQVLGAAVLCNAELRAERGRRERSTFAHERD